MRISNIQDTLLKIDLVQRLEEALLSHARLVQSESEPAAREHTRVRQEVVGQPADTRETAIREEYKRRREPFAGRRHKKDLSDDEPKTPPGNHIIDITA